jgi:hypothetical protein
MYPPAEVDNQRSAACEDQGSFPPCPAPRERAHVLADECGHDGGSGDRRDDPVTSVEPAIGHSIIAIAPQLTHDRVATERDRNDLIPHAVRDEDTWLPDAVIRQRSPAREDDHTAEEVTICEPEPQRHACPGREAADCNAPGIDSATCESALKRSVNEPDIGLPESPRRSGRRWRDDHEPWDVPGASERVETSGRAPAARPVERDEEGGRPPTPRRRHTDQRSAPWRDAQLVLSRRARLCVLTWAGFEP